MKITFYSSNTLNSACNAVIDALGVQNTQGTHPIFIAPDKFSLSVEKAIFERLGISATFNIDVVSFMRLAVKALGPTAGDCLTKEGALLVFKKVLNRHANNLVHYGRVARMPGFASEMYAVITSFRNNCHSPEDILQAADSLDKNTKKKALDIALLYKEYIKELEEGYPDGTLRLDRFLADANKSEFVRGADIYIAGFSSFSAKQYQIIAALMRHAKSVSIGVTPYNGGKNASYYPFYTLERLKDLVELYGAEYREIECFETLQEPFGTLNRGLFAASGEKARADDKFVLVEENTVYEEINGIAKEIVSWTSCKGLRYKDIGVVCCNDKYRELIRNIFARYGIPCFIDQKYRMKDALGTKYLLSALDTVEFGFRQDKILAYVKNPLCGIENTDADEFENYVLEHCINYAGFLTPFPNQGGVPEAVRQKIAKDLSVFGTKKQLAGEFSRVCRAFMSREEVATILQNETELTDDALIKASNLQAIQKLFQLLDEIETLIGDEEYPFGECKNILTSCIEGTELSLIPQYADCVFVGNLSDSLYDKLEILFVITATGDVLPAAHTYQAIISAKDSILMEKAGLRLYPAPPDLIKEDMFALLDLFTKASRRIYFGYSGLAPDGRKTRPSPVVAELKDIVDTKPISLYAKHSVMAADDNEALSSAAASQKNAFFEFLQTLPKVSRSGDKVSQNLDILYCSLSEEYRARIDELIYRPALYQKPDGALYFGKDEHGRYLTKATQLESYFQCPYAHHLQHGLKLIPRRDGKLQRNNAGIVIHRVLELFFRRTKGTLRKMSTKELKAVSETVIKEVFSDLKTVGDSSDLFTKNALESIRKECAKLTLTLADKVKKSSYTPALVEHSFGDDDEIVLHVDGNRFLVRGKIDRVDTKEDEPIIKAVVIDYKTGSAKSPDAYYGNSLQLWLYLRALEHLGYEPEGAFYLPISDAPGKEDKPFLLNGYFDESELGNFDNGIYALQEKNGIAESETIHAKLNAKNKIVCKYAVEKSVLKDYIDYNVEIAKLALQELLAGNIEKSPQKNNGCANCRYLLLCGGADTVNCRRISEKCKPQAKKEETRDD